MYNIRLICEQTEYDINLIDTKCAICRATLGPLQVQMYSTGTNLPVILVPLCDDCIHDTAYQNNPVFDVYDSLSTCLKSILNLTDSDLKNEMLQTLLYEIENVSDVDFRPEFKTLLTAVKA